MSCIILKLIFTLCVIVSVNTQNKMSAKHKLDKWCRQLTGRFVNVWYCRLNLITKIYMLVYRTAMLMHELSAKVHFICKPRLNDALNKLPYVIFSFDVSILCVWKQFNKCMICTILWHIIHVWIHHRKLCWKLIFRSIMVPGLSTLWNIVVYVRNISQCFSRILKSIVKLVVYVTCGIFLGIYGIDEANHTCN